MARDNNEAGLQETCPQCPTPALRSQCPHTPEGREYLKQQRLLRQSVRRLCSTFSPLTSPPTDIRALKYLPTTMVQLLVAFEGPDQPSLPKLLARSSTGVWNAYPTAHGMSIMTLYIYRITTPDSKLTPPCFTIRRFRVSSSVFLQFLVTRVRLPMPHFPLVHPSRCRPHRQPLCLPAQLTALTIAMTERRHPSRLVPHEAAECELPGRMLCMARLTGRCEAVNRSVCSQSRYGLCVTTQNP